MFLFTLESFLNTFQKHIDLRIMQSIENVDNYDVRFRGHFSLLPFLGEDEQSFSITGGGWTIWIAGEGSMNTGSSEKRKLSLLFI